MLRHLKRQYRKLLIAYARYKHNKKYGLEEERIQTLYEALKK